MSGKFATSGRTIFRVPSLPDRPIWRTDQVTTAKIDAPTSDAGMWVMQMWSHWADKVEAILRQMADEVRSLDLEEWAEDDLVDLAVRTAKYFPRPGMPVNKSGDDRLVSIHDEWGHWGDCVEDLYLCMSENIARCTLKASERRGLIKGDEGDLGLSGLSLSPINTTLANLPALIRAMLSPESLIQGNPELGTSCLVRRLEILSIGSRAIERSVFADSTGPTL